MNGKKVLMMGVALALVLGSGFATTAPGLGLREATAAGRLTLFVTALDASGTTISSVVRPILDSVPAGDRAYFVVDAPSGAASYQVGVESWDFVEGAS